MNPPDPIPLDQLTRHTERALGFLFLRDRIRAPLGVVLGGSLWTLSELFAPALEGLTFLDLAAMSWWRWLLLGILIMHGRTILRLIWKPSSGSDTLDTVIELIERADFSAVERRQRYRRLIDRYAEYAAEHAVKQEGAQTERALD
jgi:hypothetical protein